MATSTDNATAADAPEEMFEVFSSSLRAHKIVTPEGKTLHFLNGKHMTKDVDDIAFLDEQVRKGSPYIRRGEAVPAKAADPMQKLRDQIRAEMAAELKAQQDAIQMAAEAGVVNTGESTTDAPKLNPATTAKLASLAGKSNSAPAK